MPYTSATYLKYANLQMAAESLLGLDPAIAAPGSTSTSMSFDSLADGDRGWRLMVQAMAQFRRGGVGLTAPQDRHRIPMIVDLAQSP